jgi:hypothetical protein
MLPVDISNKFQGSCLSRNDSTKSESFVTTTHCSVKEKVINAYQWYDYLAEGQACGLFEILPRVAGERAVVEVERQ